MCEDLTSVENVNNNVHNVPMPNTAVIMIMEERNTVRALL